MRSYKKYKNQKIIIDGIKFDSKAEGRRYKELKLLEELGLIKSLKLQPKFELQEKFVCNGKTERAINYIGDFEYFDVKKERLIVEDVKGVETDVFKLKRKWFLYKYYQKYDLVVLKV